MQRAEQLRQSSGEADPSVNLQVKHIKQTARNKLALYFDKNIKF